MFASLIASFTPPLAMAMTLYGGVQAASTELASLQSDLSVIQTESAALPMNVASPSPAVDLRQIMTSNSLASLCASLTKTLGADPANLAFQEFTQVCMSASVAKPDAQPGAVNTDPIL